ncbi:MAG: arylsulfatase [Phenylobacterium sp.]|uniref:arylsulfatase n=1 Tax=Phenylobacterium sp. TaxID=1871053 RepID=UPI00271FB790|nr:arylsulfatase [Phenylobacterium sp.]MDO8410153.1 arylsulfatase [Phenylobacterium sp.]
MSIRAIWTGIARTRRASGACGLGVVFAVLAASLALAQPAAGPPNIVLILVDDAGYTDFGAYGSEIATPTIDALAARGVRFSNFHATPMCAPSRAMLMTGVDSHNAGVANLPESTPRAHRDLPAYQGRLAPGVETLATRLKRGGYRTYMAGKWHLGHGPGDLPDSHGFDRSFAMDATGADNWDQRSYFPLYERAPWFEDGQPATLPKDFYSSAFLVDRMIAYIDGAPGGEAARPFFAYLPFLAIHIPVQAPETFVRKYEATYLDGWAAQRARRREGAIRSGLIAADTPMGPAPGSVADWNALTADEQALAARSMAVNAAMLEAMDHHLGRLVAHLKARGQYDNTLFVVLSDNGPEAGDPTAHPLFRAWMRRQGYSQEVETLGGPGTYAAIGPGWASAAAAPGALYKFYAGEGGLRVPLILAGPGLPQGQTERAFTLISDIAPTVLDLAGVPGSGPPMQGRTLGPVLRGQASAVYGPQDPVGLEAAGEAALFKGDYKLTRNAGAWGDPAWRLYDIVRDPGETRDLAAEQPARVAEMLADYQAYAEAVGAAEIPEGFSADRQVAANLGLHILADFRIPLLAGLGLVIAVIAAVVLGARHYGRRQPERAARLGRLAMRGLLGAVGLLFVAIALRIWTRPESMAATLGLAAQSPLGLATLRADMGAFFAGGGLFVLAAAVRDKRSWLAPAQALLSLALMGRVVSLLAGGWDLMSLPPMVLEAALILILAAGWRVLTPR